MKDGLAPILETGGFAQPATPWIQVASGAPYFVDEEGAPFTPIGENDAITWPTLAGLFRRRDLGAVERHLVHLRAHGVTCLRLMLEYAEVRHGYFEQPIGVVRPNMVRLWDDLFALCERTGMRVLLTPFDTFWTWLQWAHHPYNEANGGRTAHPSRMLVCRETRAAIKARLSFAVQRWGGSGALFAWDLWNEIHPAQAEGSVDGWGEFIHDLSNHVRGLETRLYGRSHPQTVSLFGPELTLQPHLDMAEPIFRHPDLDFASIHIYAHGTIDDPRNTVDAALDMGRHVRESLAQITDGRPFLDSEHGPIHTFKDKQRTLPEPFDDEYFRHLAWAHLASGGAGGGMRWPNRHPHMLTDGMRRAQRAMAAFLPLIDWSRFARRNLSAEVTAARPRLAAFACGDARQAVVWLLRRDTIAGDGRLKRNVAPTLSGVRVPGLQPGRYRVTPFDTDSGVSRPAFEADADAAGLSLVTPPFTGDLALSVSPA
jgi:mannan endo-1,4-beta-mannosidase